jgi:hypothetical protein
MKNVGKYNNFDITVADDINCQTNQLKKDQPYVFSAYNWSSVFILFIIIWIVDGFQALGRFIRIQDHPDQGKPVPSRDAKDIPVVLVAGLSRQVGQNGEVI